MSPHMPRPESSFAGSAFTEASGIGGYREAVKRADLAGAARYWQEGIRTPLAADFQREFDFSLVQEYSLAWQTGNLPMLQAIGKKAVAHPDRRLSHLLAQVVDAPAPGGAGVLGDCAAPGEAAAAFSEAAAEGKGFAHPEVTDAVPAALMNRGRDFLKGLVQASRQGEDVRKFTKKFRVEKTEKAVDPEVKRVAVEAKVVEKVEKTPQSKSSLKPDSYKKDQVAPQASDSSGHPQHLHHTLKELIDFLNQAAIRNRIALTDLEIETLRNHQDLEIPLALGNREFDRWASQQNLKLTAKSLKQLYRASLLLANRMTATEASSLAMAARSAQTKKKSPSPPPENPPA